VKAQAWMSPAAVREWAKTPYPVAVQKRMERACPAAKKTKDPSHP